MKILIDGYNLIFECGLHGKRINSASLANARMGLLQTIKKRVANELHKETTVVFDAKRQPLSGQQERESYGGIEVLYSVNYPDADELIELLIKKHAAPKQLLVVSSDHRLQKAALRRKSKTIDSGDWYDQILEEDFVEQEEQESAGRSSNSLLTDEDLARFKKDIDKELGG